MISKVESEKYRKSFYQRASRSVVERVAKDHANRIVSMKVPAKTRGN